MASVRKRTWTHKGVEKTAWIVDYIDQAGKRRMVTKKTKKDADRERLRIESEIEAGVHTHQRDSATFGEACHEWVRDCDRRHKIKDRMSGTTVYKNECLARLHLIPKLGRYRLTELTRETLQQQVEDWALEYEKSTVQEFACAVRLVLKMALKRKWLKVSPIQAEPLHVPGRRNERAIPSKDEIEQFLRALPNRNYRESEIGHRTRVVSVILAVFAGMRRGEVCGLQWENVDFKDNVIRIRHSLSRVDGLKGPKTEAGRRTIPMADPVRRTLLWAAEAETGPLKGYVIHAKNGGPICPGNIYWFWSTTCKAAGLTRPSPTGEKAKWPTPKYPFHALRHAAVSLLIDQGLQPFHIKSFVGHSSVKTTMDVYGHMFPDDERARMAAEGAASQFSYQVPEYVGALPKQQACDKAPQLIEI